MDTDEYLEVPREHRRPDDHQDTYHVHERNNMNGNGIVKQIMVNVIVFLVAVGMTAFALDTKFVRQSAYEKDIGELKLSINTLIAKNENLNNSVIELNTIIKRGLK